MEAVDERYLAGLIDGEGCIRVFKVSRYAAHTVRLTIAMLDGPLLQDVQASFGGTLKLYPRPGKKPVWIWYVDGKRVPPVLERVLPFLRLKRRQAELALDLAARKIPYQQTKKLSLEELAYRERLVEECRRLNSGDQYLPS